MNLMLAIAAVCGIAIQQPENQVSVRVPAPFVTSVAPRAYDNPNDAAWKIAYFPEFNMLSLNWGPFNNPLIPFVTVTFQGVSQNVNMNTNSYVLFTSVTITPNTTYTISVGRSYYFVWDGTSDFCTITGHN